MKAKLIRRTSLGAQYVQSKYAGKNESGVAPVGDSVLILIDDSVTKTAGGIELPENLQEHHKAAAETGVMVAVGEGAFKYSSDRAREFVGRKPKAGDRVYYQRYAGQIVIGQDGLEYRVMTDKCIAGIDIG